MSIFKRWFGSISDPAPFTSFFAASSSAGKPVSLEISMSDAANWACVWTQAKAVAGMPLQMFRKETNGSRVAIDHPLADILSGSPNADQTALEFWESMVGWLLARGNAFALIERSGNRVVALTLLPAEKVDIRRHERTNDLIYRYSDRGKQIEFPAESVFHIKGPSFGTDSGLDPIRFGANVLGGALAAEETASKLLGSGLMPSGILSANVDLTKAQKNQLRDMLKEFSGSNNAGKVLTLPEGLTYTPISIDPESMQLLETRRFSVEMVCLFHGVPPAILGFSSEGTTQWGTGIEALQLQWLATGLNPILRRIEARIRKQLLGPKDRGVYAEFNRESLLQMDSASKANYISKMTNSGNMTPAEGREKRNFRFIEGSDVLLVNGNMVPLQKLGEAPDMRSTMQNWLSEEKE